ncbi:MAG: beta-ketoacyl-ACP synthase 3 [Phycisphaerales bacterium]|nr:beta-ketoacyl-ACP synthase 3 [Phycisphaerales bacterium]
MSPKQLDMVICATITPEMVCPSTAAQVVADVGAVPAAAMDLNAACSGFVYALSVATAMIRTGQAKTIAVIGTETLSSITDWKDRRTCVLFGDGAGAVILTASDDAGQGPLHTIMHSDGSMWQELYVPRDQHNIPPGDKIFSGNFNTLQMNGQAIFKFAVSTLKKVIDESLAAHNLKPADLAMIIPHQSNIRILESARDRLGLGEDKLYINIDRYGNTSGASVPICLHELWSSGKSRPATGAVHRHRRRTDLGGVFVETVMD